MIFQRLLGKIGSQRLLKLAFTIRPESELLIFKEQRLTRRQAFADIQALGGGLQALGIRRGERIATLLPACPTSFYTMFLPQMMGTVNVPLNPLLSERELQHILTDCGARAVIIPQRWLGRDYPAMFERLLPSLPELRRVIVLDAPEGESDGDTFYSMAELMGWGKKLASPTITGEDLSLITYTSGTTGLPKGVMHNPQRTFGLAVRSVGPRLDMSLMRSLLLPFPPYQFGGMLGSVAALLGGGKIVLMDRFDPLEMLAAIERERVTQVVGSPTMYRLMLRAVEREHYDLSSLRRLTFSAEPCPPELARAIHAHFGCNIENIYATTESMVISWTGLDDGWEMAATTVGKPAPGVQVRIVDDRRHPLPTGERGEIAVRTSQMMLGYYNAPDLSVQALDADGWYYTGDIGTIGEDGYLRLSDRKKDLIIRAGQNIFPAEIETVLHTHAGVRRAAVVGVPHPLTGEAIWAFVEPQPGAQLTVIQVVEHCRGQIAPFKMPEQVRFVERLPVTAIGKVQKYKLRELAQEELTHA
ncbi:MAG TPA: class I adenylate-forming enzyme family protein [Anaerolineales bacterium]|nr:class I adenylate-forming enzyme family protein [Anaerolineales bacterium]